MKRKEWMYVEEFRRYWAEVYVAKFLLRLFSQKASC